MENNLKFYIDGTWVVPYSDVTIPVINPATEQEIAPVAIGNAQDADRAVAAAKKAFPAWADTPVSERIALLKKLLAVYQERNEQMGDIISEEMGAPITIAHSQQATVGSLHLTDAIEAMENFVSENIVGDNDCIMREPMGVCGLITPWNWPMNQVMLKISPALAAGCTVVLKPSELSPFNAIFLAEMIDEVGFPAGVFNLVNGDGEGVGTCLSSHPDIAMISFTGSTRAGKAISKSAADTIKRVSLELGGKGANIIFADADENAVKRGVLHCFHNSGQSCNAPTRMLVERSIYENAVATAKSVAEHQQVGMPNEEGRHIGPVISKVQYDKIQSLIQSGIDEGATLLVGGTGKPDGFETGYFVRPTIFTDVTPDMTLWEQEVFGPVLTITPFDTEEQAIAMANDTVYGLTNYIQTTDENKARRVARQMRTGQVEMNGADRATSLPFGGYGQSGNGREGGHWGLEDFLETKAVTGWSQDS